MKHLAVVALILAAVACTKDKNDNGSTSGSAATTTTATAGSSSGMAGGGAATGSADSGSAAAMSGSGSSASGSAMAAGSGMAGSGSAAAGSGAATSGSGAAMSGSGAGSDGFNWEAMSHDERTDYMKKTVVPTMKPLFQKFDPKHYANFGCKTCHGKNPKAVKFKMPTPDLPPLDFAALKAGKQKPDIAKWMGEVVKPQMATLMHEPEYSESNPKGFGCLECHTQKK